MSRPARLRRSLIAALCCALSACATNTAATATPTTVRGLPTALPTRTPRPTPVVADDLMLDNMSAAPAQNESAQVRGLNIVRSATGDIEGLGEVFNATDQTMARVQVRTSLLAADGTVLAAKTVLVAREIVGPHSVSPFRVHFPSSPVGVHDVRVEAIPGDPISSERLLTLEPQNLSRTMADHRVTVRGSLPGQAWIALPYTIQAGDTLLGIAVKLGVEIDEVTANNPTLQPDALPVGESIIVRASVRKVQLTVIAYDSQKRVIGHRAVDVTNAVTSIGPDNGTVPFEVSVVTLTRDVADSKVIAEVFR